MKEKKKKNKGLLIAGIILSIIGIIVTILLALNIIKLDIIPTKYFSLFIIIEIIGNIIISILLTRGRVISFIIGLLFLIVLITGNVITNSYVNTTHKFFIKSFTSYVLEDIDYIVLTSVNNKANTLEETKDTETFYYYKYSKAIDKALKELGNHQFSPCDSVSSVLVSFNENPYNYLVISKGNYEYLIDSTNVFTKENYKIIKEYTINLKERRNNEVKNSFTVYLNGLDFTGIMRDFNMLITVNLNKKKILLTPILRGYYIDVPAYNIKDTLMCLGSFDSNVSKEALEKLFQTKIDYTVNINTNSLVDVVETLNGVEFCSNYSFTTTHALVLGTYDDKGKEKLYVQQGCRNYNGIEILTIARERLHLKNNERGRIDNCKKIMMSIGKKALTITSLMNYKEVLDSIGNLYTTDMNKEMILKLAKMALENPNSFQVEEQTVDGTDSFALGHLGTVEVGVTIPDYNQVNLASQKINDLLK